MSTPRRWTRCLWLPALLLACADAGAATYHVRSDGGTAAQCDGTADAPYPGQGRGQACAWQHPFIALPPQAAPLIAGGDTLVIGPGSYMLGAGAPNADTCAQARFDDCVMAPVPSGPTPARPTRILGVGHDRGCKAPPELWSTQGAYAVVNLTGSSNVEVACLDITDHSACIVDHNRDGNDHGETDRCRDNAPPYGRWGAYGIYAADSSQVLLRDLHIHGLAANGIRAGRLRNWTLQRVRLRANGWAGWDGNLDESGATSSSNQGYIRFSGGEIAWNGCGERYPSRRVFGCWAQQQGGYGDGLGTADSGGHWLFEDLSIHHNTSDGLDLLYMDGTGSVTIRRVRAQGNAGNQIKVSGPVTIENTIALGDCSYFARFPTASLGNADHCRAKGNTVSLRPRARSVATLRHNTIAGQGDCLLITTHGDATARVRVQNNLFFGGREWRGSPDLTCAHYAMESATPVTFENNFFWNTKDGFCPPGNLCGRDPRLTLPTYPDFDARPGPGSPLIDAAMPLPGVDHDFFGNPRPAGKASDIGAIEVQGRSR